MKGPRILFIAPSSYPMYGADANVNTKVVKVLTDAGCVVDLFCHSQKNRPKNYPLSENEFYFGRLNSIHSVEVNTQKNLKRHFSISRHRKYSCCMLCRELGSRQKV